MEILQIIKKAHTKNYPKRSQSSSQIYKANNQAILRNSQVSNKI